MTTILLLMALVGAPVNPPIVILRGDSAGLGDAAGQRRAEACAERTAAALAAVGAPTETVSDLSLNADQLAGVRLAVLPYNKVDDALAARLADYVRGGGRLAAFFTTGSGRFDALMGIRRGPLRAPAYTGQYRAIRFTQGARQRLSALPGELAQDSWTAFELSPLPGTEVIGEWGSPPRETPAAVTLGPAGVYVAHVLTSGDLYHKGLFLVSLAARADPAVWAPVLDHAWQQAQESCRQAVDRWERLRDRDDVSAERLGRLEPEVLALAVRAAALPAPEVTQGPATRLALYRRLANQAAALSYRLVPSRPHELRGLWVFAGRPLNWTKLAWEAKSAGLNAIFYRVARGGMAVYPSRQLPRDTWAGEADEVAAALRACHRYGLQFHAWRVCYHMGSAPEELRRQLRESGRLSVDLAGHEALYANPGDPRNEALELAVLREIVDRYDVDGVMLDYARYGEEPSFEFDYSATSRREFERALGQAVERWPDDVAYGALKPRYESWLRDNVSRLVRRAAVELRDRDPRVVLSAAVWRNPAANRYAVKQDWPRWVREGWLDLVVPMDYTRDPAALADETAAQLAVAAPHTPLAVGLGVWLLDRPAALVNQVEVVRDAGAGGFVLFSSNAANLSDCLAALKDGATAEPAQPVTAEPRARWRLGGVIRQAEGAPAAGIGDQVSVELVLGPGPTTGKSVTGVVGAIRLVRPGSAKDVAEVVRFVGLGSLRAEATGRFECPAGRAQLVASGTYEPEAGKPLPFEIRGPVIEGWTPARVDALRRRRQPPVFRGSGLRVGVWSDGVGSEPVLAALRRRRAVTAAPLYRLEPDHLAVVQAVVLPGLHDVSPLYRGGDETLRAWVAAGGTAVLLHEATGRRWHPVLFPEVGRGDGVSRRQLVAATGKLAGLPAGWRLSHAWRDHVRLVPASGAVTLLTEADGGAPVIVEARVGQGRVVLCGLLLGARGTSGAMPKAEEELLLLLLGLRRSA